jgi:hypothetical protein
VSSSDPSLNTRRNPTPATIQLPYNEDRQLPENSVPPPLPARNLPPQKPVTSWRNLPPRHYPKPPVRVSTTPRKPPGQIFKRFANIFKSPKRSDIPQSRPQYSSTSNISSNSSPPQAQALRTPIPSPRQESHVVSPGIPRPEDRWSSEPQVTVPSTTVSSGMPAYNPRPRSPSDAKYGLRPRSHPSYKE